MKKSLLLLGGIVTALTSVAKNGITWEPYQPVKVSAQGCAKAEVFTGDAKATSSCSTISYDTLMVSTQTDNPNECAHYRYEEKYYLVAKDSCDNADTLYIGVKLYGNHYQPSDSLQNDTTISSFTHTYWYNGTILTTAPDTIELMADYNKNCTFTMPDVPFEVDLPKCAVFNGPIFKEQSIEAGEVLSPHTRYAVLTIKDYCETYATISVRVKIQNRKDIVSITSPDTSVVIVNETANLASKEVADAKGSIWVKDWDESWALIPSTILTDIYRDTVDEGNIIYSKNHRTYGDKFTSLTDEERLNLLTLKSAEESGRYAFVAVDTLSGCSDTAYTYIKVEDQKGIYWIEKSEPFERTSTPCDHLIVSIDSMPQGILTDINMPNPVFSFMAKSSCSDVLHYYFMVSDQNPSEEACDHYNYDVRYYVAAKDTCGNSDTLLIGTEHYVTKMPEIYNTIITNAPEYLGGCEFAIPDLSKNPYFDYSDSCTANFRLIQTTAPGTRITKRTYVTVYFADACHDSVFAYNVEIPINKEETVKINALDSATVTAGASVLEWGNIYATFQAYGSVWETDWDGAAVKVPSSINKYIYKEDGTKLEYPYILSSTEDNGYYTVIATDSISGCSDTIVAYITVDTLHASSPVIAAELNDTKVDIYTPSGILLKKNVYFKNVMDELKAGIYIVNNKKYYLKK